MHVSSWCTLVSCASEFLIFSTLKLSIMWTCGFHRYKHLYTYKRQEFQNFLGRKLTHRQLLHICQKTVEHGIKHDIATTTWFWQIYMCNHYTTTIFYYLFLLYLNVHKKQAFKCLFKMPLWCEIDNATLYCFIFLVKIWGENIISIQIHPGIIYFWIWLSGGAAYQRGEEAEAKRVCTD